MTSIKLGNDGNYRLISNVKGKQITAVLGKDRGRAEAELKRFYLGPEEWVENRKPGVNKKTAEAVKEYLLYSKRIKNGSTHLREKTRVLNTMVQMSKELEHIRSWKPEHCWKYVNARQTHDVSSSTIRREFLVIRSFWNWAVEKRYVTKSPTKNLIVPPKKEARQDRRKIITKKQIRKLKDKLDPGAFGAVVLIYACGAKPGELKELKDKDLVKEERWGFTHKLVLRKPRREVPVVDSVVHEAFYLALGMLAKHKSKKLRLNTQLSNALKALKEPHYVLGDLRDAAITRWVDEGVDLITVAKWSGHTSLDDTARYVKKDKPARVPRNLSL